MSSDEADKLAEDHEVKSLRAEGRQDRAAISADFVRCDGVVSDAASDGPFLAPTVTPSPLEGHEERRDRELKKQNVRERKMTLEPPARIAPSPLGPGEAAEQARERKRKRLGAGEMSLGPNLEDELAMAMGHSSDPVVRPENDARGSLFGFSEAPLVERESGSALLSPPRSHR